MQFAVTRRKEVATEAGSVSDDDLSEFFEKAVRAAEKEIGRDFDREEAAATLFRASESSSIRRWGPLLAPVEKFISSRQDLAWFVAPENVAKCSIDICASIFKNYTRINVESDFFSSLLLRRWYQMVTEFAMKNGYDPLRIASRVAEVSQVSNDVLARKFKCVISRMYDAFDSGFRTFGADAKLPNALHIVANLRARLSDVEARRDVFNHLRECMNRTVRKKSLAMIGDIYPFFDIHVIISMEATYNERNYVHAYLVSRRLERQKDENLERRDCLALYSDVTATFGLRDIRGSQQGVTAALFSAGRNFNQIFFKILSLDCSELVVRQLLTGFIAEMERDFCLPQLLVDVTAE